MLNYFDCLFGGINWPDLNDDVLFDRLDITSDKTLIGMTSGYVFMHD